MNKKNKYVAYNDLELISEYKESLNPELIGILFKKYSPMIYSICYKYFKDKDSSKDASIDVFEILLEKLKTHQVVNFKSWLHSLVKNHCLMQLRSFKLKFEYDDTLKNEDSKFMEDEDFLHQDIVDKENMLVALELCIPKLINEQRICIELFYIEQKSYMEICEQTGFDFKKVKSNIQNGKRNLKIMLESYYGK